MLYFGWSRSVLRFQTPPYPPMKPLGIVPCTLITVSITFTFMFLCFFTSLIIIIIIHFIIIWFTALLSASYDPLPALYRRPNVREGRVCSTFRFLLSVLEDIFLLNWYHSYNDTETRASNYYYYYYYTHLWVFSTSVRLMVFHRSLSDSKSTQVYRTLLSILAVLNNGLVLMVYTCPLISNSSSPCTNPGPEWLHLTGSYLWVK